MKNYLLSIVYLFIFFFNCQIIYAFPIAKPGTEGIEIIVNTSEPVIATYQGNSANYSNDLYLLLDSSGQPGDDGILSNDLFIFNNHRSPVGAKQEIGTFQIGTKLIFRLYVNNTGINFYTGPAKRNPDNHTHARVQGDWKHNEALVSFEDLYNGGTQGFHYNDLSFSFTNVQAFEKPIVSGCITLKDSPIKNGKAMLMQSGQLFQSVPLDKNGCYEFYKVQEDQPFNVTIRRLTE